MDVDPTTATIGANAVLKAIDLGVSYFRARSDSSSAKDGKNKERRELALHLWGCLLMEMKMGCERVRFMAKEAEENIRPFAPFDFSVSDAILREFAVVVPSPFVLQRFQSILAALKRVDFFQRIAAHDPGNLGLYGKGSAFACDAISKNIVGRFNDLVRLGHHVARATYGEQNWGGDAANIFPTEIDPSSPIDHSLI